MNKRGNTKVESNDSPEIQDKTETSDIPRLPSGGSSLEPAVMCLLLRSWTSCNQNFFCQEPRFTTFLSITSDHCTYKSPDGFRCVDLSVLIFLYAGTGTKRWCATDNLAAYGTEVS